MLALTAIVLALLAPVVRTGWNAGVGGAERSQRLLDRGQTEQALRTLLAGAAPDSVRGDARSLSVLTIPRVPAACAPAGAATRVTLELRDRPGGGGVLLCRARGQVRSLLQWRSGAGSFAFSADAQSWLTELGPLAGKPVLLRLAAGGQAFHATLPSLPPAQAATP